MASPSPLPTSQRAYITTYTGIPSLTLETHPVPSPTTLAPTAVLIRIRAVSLNYRDIEVVEDRYGHHAGMGKPARVVPCGDMAGDVVAVGEGVEKWRVGDRVVNNCNPEWVDGEWDAERRECGLGLPADGTLREYIVLPSHGLVRAPTHLTYAEASTLPIAYVTAWNALWGAPKPLLPGQCVLVQGTGGVSIAAAQLAKAAGCKVILTSSSDAKCARAREQLGADLVVNYATTPAWDEAVAAWGEPVDHVIEVGGRETLARSFAAVRFGGVISAIGYVSGKGGDGSTNAGTLALAKCAVLRGLQSGSRRQFEELARFVEGVRLRPVVDRVFKFEEAREALGWLKEGRHFGKVVVEVG